MQDETEPLRRSSSALGGWRDFFLMVLLTSGFFSVWLTFGVSDCKCWKHLLLERYKTFEIIKREKFSFKYSLLLRSRLLSNTVHSQLKTTAWLLPERHGSTRCSNIGSYVCPVHSHQLPWGVFGTFWPVGNVGREGLWPTEETKGISQMVKSS